MTLRIAMVLLLLIAPLAAQGNLQIRNLEVAAIDSVVEGNWLAFSVWEAGQQEDLNGDGDTSDPVVHVGNLETGQMANLGLAGTTSGDGSPLCCNLALSGSWLAFAVDERSQGQDLNGDGDTEDAVSHTHDLETGETTNLRLGDNPLSPFRFSVVSDNWLAFAVDERSQGQDLNGDGGIRGSMLHVHNLETGETTNLMVAVSYDYWSFGLTSNWLVFAVLEAFRSQDLNGDGDTEDWVLHVRHLETGQTSNLQMSIVLFPQLTTSGNWLAFAVDERSQGADLNGDGDTNDSPMLYVHNLETGETTNLMSVVDPYSVLLSGTRLAFDVIEFPQGQDLNGDGDTEDVVLHFRDLEARQTASLGLAGVRELEHYASSFSEDENWLAFAVSELSQGQDLNRDGDTEDLVLHLFDIVRDHITNLGIAAGASVALVAFSGHWMTFRVSESSQDQDLNGDGDTEDAVLHVGDLSSMGDSVPFVRGDCNGDGQVTGQVTDAVFLLSFNFRGGPPPPAPFGACGVGGTEDFALGCREATAGCQ